MSTEAVTITIHKGIAQYWLDQCDEEISFWKSEKAVGRTECDPDEMIKDWGEAKQKLTEALNV